MSAPATAVHSIRVRPDAHDVRYRPEIDGLRTIAVCSVIFYHAHVPLFNGGFAGVDIFFVISGYLISAIIWGDLNKGDFSFFKFYERRARRIFPALFTVLATSIFASFIVFTPQQLDDFGKSLIATVVFSANLYFSTRLGYFNHDIENSALIHMWSLAVEEQFYLLFPVLLIGLARFRPIGRNPVLLVATLLSLGWCLYRERTDPSGSFFSTPARAWELLSGALVTVNRERWLAISAKGYASWGLFLELAGAVLMIGTIFSVSGAMPWPGKATIPVVVGTSLVLLAARDVSPVGRMLSLKPMVAIGLISYSAYLWHQPLFAFAHAIVPGSLSPVLLILLIGATFVLAWLSWRYIETPFRVRGRISRGALVAFAIAMPIIFGLAGWILHFARGFPGRYPATTLAVARSMQPSPHRAGCHTDGLRYREPANACRYYGRNVTWAVLGDSHGIEVGEALAEDLRERDQGLLHLTFSGCQAALTFQSDNPGCSAWTRAAVEYLRSQPSIANVLIAYRPTFYLFGDQLLTYPAISAEHPNFLAAEGAEAARDAYWISFERIVNDLLRAGKHVVIMRPIPELPVHVDRYIYKLHATNDVAGTSLSFYQTRNQWVNNRLDILSRKYAVTIIDPAAAFCDTRTCWAIKYGKSLYFDDNHPSMVGARRIISVARIAGQLP